MSTTKERLKALRKITPVPISGETFHVRALSLAELEQIDQTVSTFVGIPDGEKKVAYARHLLAKSVCEADGAAVFEGPDDPGIDQVNTDALRTLTDAAAEANGLSGGDQGND